MSATATQPGVTVVLGTGAKVAAEWLPADAVAEVFGISRTRLWHMRNAGEVRWRKLPGQGNHRGLLFSAESIRQYIERSPGGEVGQPARAEA